ncbi:MAG: flagellar basal body-associated protein FliL [Marmoricola sp.]|nr:flagellar basal body-associated protein FliL [Marmoricola sp.]
MTVTAIPQTAAEAAEAGKATTKTKNSKDAKEPKSMKKLVMIVAAVLVVAGGGYWFTKPAAPPGPPQPGSILKLDSIQINLAGEHYLRVGIALQLVAGSSEADGTKALDTTISEFSGLPMAEVNSSTQREMLKKQLETKLSTVYDKAVMGVYFTEFVTQ